MQDCDAPTNISVLSGPKFKLTDQYLRCRKLKNADDVVQ